MIRNSATAPANSSDRLTDGLGSFLDWRERIRLEFDQQSLSGVDEVHTVQVEPGTVYDPRSFDKGYDVGEMILRCISREPANI